MITNKTSTNEILKVLIPNNNNAVLKKALEQNDAKILGNTKIPNTTTEILKELVKDISNHKVSNEKVLNILQQSSQFKNLGNFSQNIKEVLNLIKDIPSLEKFAATLKEFLVDIKNVSPESLKSLMSNSPTNLESKIYNELLKSSPNVVLKDILTNLKETLSQNLKDPNHPILKKIDALLTKDLTFNENIKKELISLKNDLKNLTSENFIDKKTIDSKGLNDVLKNISKTIENTIQELKNPKTQEKVETLLKNIKEQIQNINTSKTSSSIADTLESKTTIKSDNANIQSNTKESLLKEVNNIAKDIAPTKSENFKEVLQKLPQVIDKLENILKNSNNEQLKQTIQKELPILKEIKNSSMLVNQFDFQKNIDTNISKTNNSLSEIKNSIQNVLTKETNPTNTNTLKDLNTQMDELLSSKNTKNIQNIVEKLTNLKTIVENSIQKEQNSIQNTPQDNKQINNQNNLIKDTLQTQSKESVNIKAQISNIENIKSVVDNFVKEPKVDKLSNFINEVKNLLQNEKNNTNTIKLSPEQTQKVEIPLNKLEFLKGSFITQEFRENINVSNKVIENGAKILSHTPTNLQENLKDSLNHLKELKNSLVSMPIEEIKTTPKVNQDLQNALSKVRQNIINNPEINKTALALDTTKLIDDIQISKQNSSNNVLNSTLNVLKNNIETSIKELNIPKENINNQAIKESSQNNTENITKQVNNTAQNNLTSKEQIISRLEKQIENSFSNLLEKTTPTQKNNINEVEINNLKKDLNVLKTSTQTSSEQIKTIDTINEKILTLLSKKDFPLGDLLPIKQSITNQTTNLLAQITNPLLNNKENKTTVVELDKGSTKLENFIETMPKIIELKNNSIEDLSKNDIQKNLKTALLQMQEEIRSLSQNSKEFQELSKQFEKVMAQVEYSQLFSMASNSNYIHIPFMWHLLEEGSIATKKDENEKFYCKIDLKLKDYGKLNMILALYDKNHLDISVFASQDELKDLIKENLYLLKSSLRGEEFVINQLKIFELKEDSKKEEEKIFENNHISSEYGINIKA